MKFKKILSIFLSAVLVVITLSFSTCSSFAAVMTTQEEVTNVNNYDTLMTYPEFNSKVTDGAYLCPGLMSSVSYDKQIKRITATQSMCPQAICKVNQYTLITAYDSSVYDNSSICRSVIYVLDNNDVLVKTLILPDSYHVGGIAYDSSNGLILITKASKSAVGVISLDDFNKYMRFSYLQ